MAQHFQAQQTGQNAPCLPTHWPMTHQFTTMTTTHLMETTKTTKISTTSLHNSPPDPCLISNGDQLSHWTPDPNTVCQFHTHFLQPACGHCMVFSTVVTSPTTLMHTKGPIYPNHQTPSNDNQDSSSHSIPNKEQSSTAPEPSMTASPNPVPNNNPTIVSPSILWQEASTDSASPIKFPACFQSDGICHPSTTNSFSKHLQQNELEFLATLTASQQTFEHNLQLAQTAFEEQMECLKHICAVMHWPPICPYEHSAITSTSSQLSRHMQTNRPTINISAAHYANATGTVYPSPLNTNYIQPSGNYNTGAPSMPWFKSSLFVLLPFLQPRLPAVWP